MILSGRGGSSFTGNLVIDSMSLTISVLFVSSLSETILRHFYIVYLFYFLFPIWLIFSSLSSTFLGFVLLFCFLFPWWKSGFHFWSPLSSVASTKGDVFLPISAFAVARIVLLESCCHPGRNNLQLPLGSFDYKWFRHMFGLVCMRVCRCGLYFPKAQARLLVIYIWFFALGQREWFVSYWLLYILSFLCELMHD